MWVSVSAQELGQKVEMEHVKPEFPRAEQNLREVLHLVAVMLF